ncbi:MAG: FG-GAP repeat domain-containing protein, partial [Candidatus Binatia bacterium]
MSLFGRPSWYQVDGPAVRVVAAEIDRENGLDLVTGNDAGAAGPSLSLLLNRGRGSFFPQVRMSLNPAQYILHTIAARDFDGDGTADVAVAVDDLRVFPIRTEVLVYRNTGSGQLLAPDEYPLDGLFPQCLRAGDVSGDGILDLIVCHSTVDTGAGLVSVLTGQGVAGVPDGTFDAGTDLRVGTSPVTVAIADVDADGHQDLVVGDSAQRTVSVLYGGGSAGLFEPPVVLASVKAVSAILVSNNPGDALPAILVTSLSDGNVLIFLQRSPRAFDPPASIAVRQPPADMGMADFDGDGITDLVLLS